MEMYQKFSLAGLLNVLRNPKPWNTGEYAGVDT